MPLGVHIFGSEIAWSTAMDWEQNEHLCARHAGTRPQSCVLFIFRLIPCQRFVVLARTLIACCKVRRQPEASTVFAYLSKPAERSHLWRLTIRLDKLFQPAERKCIDVALADGLRAEEYDSSQNTANRYLTANRTSR